MNLSSLELCRMGSLVYPIMLTQEAGEISEAKAAEMLGLDIVSYREEKQKAIKVVLGLVNELPSPLSLLMAAMREKPS